MQRNWEWILRIKVINPARMFSRERGDLQFCDHFGDSVQSLRLFLATASYLFVYISLQAHTLINNFLDSRNGPEIMFDFKRSRRQSKCSAQTTCFDFIHWPSVWTLRYELCRKGCSCIAVHFKQFLGAQCKSTLNPPKSLTLHLPPSTQGGVEITFGGGS